MRTRCSTRAFRDGKTWTTTVRVQRHTEDGRLPRYKTELFYRFGDFPSKDDALREGRADIRELKRHMAKTGTIPTRRL